MEEIPGRTVIYITAIYPSGLSAKLGPCHSFHGGKGSLPPLLPVQDCRHLNSLPFF